LDQKLDKAPNGYIAFNDKGIIIEVNSTICEMLGYSKQELEQTKFELLLDIAGRMFFQTHFFPMLKMQQKVDEIFLNMKAKDSTVVPVITSSVREENPDGAECVCVFLPVHNRRKYEDEILAAKKQAQEALKENKELIEAREEVSRHSKELDKRIVEIDRVNNEILQFNNIINHEMQECIRKILLFSRLGKKENQLNYFDNIIETANKLKTINASLNLFIDLDKDKNVFGSVDLNKCLDEATAQVLEETGFSGVEIIKDELPEIEGSFEDLKVLFYHLIMNAVKFRNGNEVTICISSVIFKENIYKMISRKYEYQDVVRITISDNGQGFDNKHKEHVFAILKKLNHEKGGSGIGLAMCKKILNNHHGSISIDSKENVGTTVKLVLPVEHQKDAEPDKLKPDHSVKT
jgi:sigma-B regulation protein RsbU (phosphoserine phosphatase)